MVLPINAPAVFQRLMTKVFSGHNPNDGQAFVVVAVYVDDVLVFFHTFSEHLNHLKLVFERIRAASTRNQVPIPYSDPSLLI